MQCQITTKQFSIILTIALAMSSVVFAQPWNGIKNPPTLWSNPDLGTDVRVGIGIEAPINSLDIFGALAIGQGYAGIYTAPFGLVNHNLGKKGAVFFDYLT